MRRHTQQVDAALFQAVVKEFTFRRSANGAVCVLGARIYQPWWCRTVDFVLNVSVEVSKRARNNGAVIGCALDSVIHD